MSSSALGRIAGKWFLDKNMLAIFQGRFGQFIMRPNRRHHGDGINFRG